MNNKFNGIKIKKSNNVMKRITEKLMMNPNTLQFDELNQYKNES
jgi:hypothetical protein